MSLLDWLNEWSSEGRFKVRTFQLNYPFDFFDFVCFGSNICFQFCLILLCLFYFGFDFTLVLLCLFSFWFLL